MPKNTARLGKNGMKITTISPLISESKLALQEKEGEADPRERTGLNRLYVSVFDYGVTAIIASN